jgi:hypothetical protein
LLLTQTIHGPLVATTMFGNREPLIVDGGFIQYKNEVI